MVIKSWMFFKYKTSEATIIKLITKNYKLDKTIIYSWKLILKNQIVVP